MMLWHVRPIDDGREREVPVIILYLEYQFRVPAIRLFQHESYNYDCSTVVYW